MKLEQQIKIAEKRIHDAECRRAEFAKKYNETGILLYERLAESETKTISERHPGDAFAGDEVAAL